MPAAPGYDVDVLVVGLGPAGASAAAVAAAHGLRVLAVERNATPGEPVQCAEFLPRMIGMQAPDLGGSRMQAIESMRTFVSRDAPELTAGFRGTMVDRAKFDRHLIAQARAAGTECLFATPLRGLGPNGTARIGDGETVRARVVIGADGPRSKVGAAIGAANSEIVETRQITVDLLAEHDATDIFLDAGIVGGYAWLFPRGATANLGLGVVASERARLKPLLEGLHARLAAEGRLGPTIHRHTGGAIPVGGIVGPTGLLGDTSILLAGDAAGLVNPITGAGIPAAVYSGQLAGAAAARWVAGDTDSLEDYAEDIDDTFGASLALALDRRREVMATYRRGALPTDGDLRQSWIAFPQYWRRKAQTQEAQEAT